VFYEAQFNARPGMNDSFGLSSAYGDAVNLFETDGLGQSTGRRATAKFGPAANGVAFGRVTTSLGVEYAPVVRRTFGVDSPGSLAEFRTGRGAANAPASVGPLVINELMYHVPAQAGVDDETNAVFEFIELVNLDTADLPLYDEHHPTNRWQLAGGIRFTFPPATRLTGGEIVLVVGFDPVARPDLEAVFRQRYAVPGTVRLFGPHEGALSNAGERIELQRPDAPQPPPQPDAGYVPYLVVDGVEYGDDWPWPPSADGQGFSLQRRGPQLFGNEPLHWKAAIPTPGESNLETTEFDGDHDGMPDSWEAANGLDPFDPADAALDDDSDGQNNRAEYFAGTNPQDPADVLVLSFELAEQLQRVRFPARPARSYTVEFCEDLTLEVWLKVADVDPVETAREVWVELEEPPIKVQRYYRVVMPARP
jgi:hypothetical protein